MECSLEGCSRSSYCKGFCKGHYERNRRTGSPGTAELRTRNSRSGSCSVDGCDRDIHASGFCAMHYERNRRHGDPGPAKPRNGAEGWITPKGYRMFKVGGRHISGQRLAMEESLGRGLLPEETVHHRNGVRLDNRIENLELWSSSHPAGQRVADKVDWAKEILALYEPGALSDKAVG